MRTDLGGTLEDEEQVLGCGLEPVVHTGARTEERCYTHGNQGEVLNVERADCCLDGCIPGCEAQLQNVGFQDCCGEEWRKTGAGANSKGCCCTGGLKELHAGGERSDWGCQACCIDRG